MREIGEILEVQNHGMSDTFQGSHELRAVLSVDHAGSSPNNPVEKRKNKLEKPDVNAYPASEYQNQALQSGTGGGL